MKRKKLLYSLSVLLFIIFLGVFWENKAKVGLVFPFELMPLDLNGHQRLLILAPHCDDEVLSSAGLIQAALNKGMQVRVVIATNGDGFLFATMEEFHRLYPKHQDFIAMGNLRQQESLDALRTLGVNSNQVSFLSYPDRGTPSLWETNWYKDKPFRSPFSGSDHSLYPITFNKQAVYAGEDLLGDLISILDSYRPDLVVYPHPDDVHPDHWGLSNFTRLALAMINRAHPDFQPAAYTYLVHRPDFPIPKGYKPNTSLTPPAKVFDLDRNWWRFDLNQDSVSQKGKAVNMYRSQLPLLRSLLESFVRTNELFSQPNSADIIRLETGNLVQPGSWKDSNGNNIAPVQLDPLQDLITRRLFPSADFVALYATLTPENQIQLCAKLRKFTSPTLTYYLRMKAINSSEVKDYSASNHPQKSTDLNVNLAGQYACGQFSLAELSQPWLIFVGANVEERETGILDQIAWQAIYLEPPTSMKP